MDTKKLRQKILDLAIRGKLVPQDPNDEPASVLLERIRAEKERLIAEGKIKRPKKTKASSSESHYQNFEPPFEIQDSWEWVKLEELFEINPKNEAPEETTCGFVPMALVADGFGFSHSYEKKNWGNVKKGYSHFQNGDIGIAKISPCFENRKSTIFSNLPNGIGAGTTELTILRPIIIDVNYFIYVFQSSWYINEGTKDFTGVVGQQRVSKEIFTSLYVPLPSLNEQQRIATEIQKYFEILEIIEKDKANIVESSIRIKSKILNLAMQGKLVPQNPSDEPAADMLRRINPKAKIITDNPHSWNIPESWVWVRIKEVFNPMEKSIPTGETFKYIDIDSIDNKLNVAHPKVIPSKNAPSRASRKTVKGDVVFSMVRPYLRNIAVVPEDYCIASTGFYVLNPSEAIDNSFAFLMSTAQYFVDGLNTFMKGDNSPSISKSNIEDFVIALPPLNEQNQIVKKVGELYEILDKIAESLPS